MITKNIHTIEQHQAIVGSRFQLAQLVMKRTNQLLQGAPISKGIASEFNPKNSPLPTQRYHRVALEELRTGKIIWDKAASDKWEEDQLDTTAVIFGE